MAACGAVGCPHFRGSVWDVLCRDADGYVFGVGRSVGLGRTPIRNAIFHFSWKVGVCFLGNRELMREEVSGKRWREMGGGGGYRAHSR